MLVPPPNGTTATRSAEQIASTGSTSSWLAGKTTASGAPCGAPARIRTSSR